MGTIRNLLILLESGQSLIDALAKLVLINPSSLTIKNAQQKAQQGSSIVTVMDHLFPWWCSFPFMNCHVSINSCLFVGACLEYLSYRENCVFMLNLGIIQSK